MRGAARPTENAFAFGGDVRAGFLHMDNHSDNVMCRREEDGVGGRTVQRPVLIDFGLALNLDFPNQHRLVGTR